MTSSDLPYWKLSSFYLFYFSTLGALIPYWGLYLQSLGFSAAEIGELIAILALTKLIAPNIWGWVADYTGKGMWVVRITSLLALLSFSLLLWVQNYLALALVMALFSFFWNASLPQFEAVTFSHLGKNSHAYGRIRLWGSLGFIFLVVLLGPLLDRFGVETLPWIVLWLFVLLWLSSLLVPEAPASDHSSSVASLWSVLKQPKVVALLLACFLLQASHGPYYVFYSIYLEQASYSKTVIGLLWALGVVAEIGVFLWASQLLRRFHLGKLLALSLFLTALRWLLIAYFVEVQVVLLFAQLLHAASFGLYHLVAISFIHRFFVGRHQGRGQAIYASVSFGAGGAVGSYFAGQFWQPWGAELTFLVAGGVALLAALVAYWGLLSRDEFVLSVKSKGNP
ncbi:MAG: MFS transporter [Gammaproteobacteria bacterium]|nr:MFS transporter [Gammaproteobacteria bacterium]